MMRTLFSVGLMSMVGLFLINLLYNLFMATPSP